MQEQMLGFLCPVCGKPLYKQEKSAVCTAGHSYDIARKGYVNLLLSQQRHNKQHGDDKEMVSARRDFLETGAYAPLREKLAALLEPLFPTGGTLLDAGCGECYYTSFIAQALQNAGKAPTVLGVDISREALQMAGARKTGLSLAVASVFRLPVAEKSCDAVLQIFSPTAGEEYTRVLKTGGILLRVTPLPRHLWELKQAVYDTPYENTPEVISLPGFTLLREENVCYPFILHSPKEIMDLFTMTPYAQKTAPQDKFKLTLFKSLPCRAEFFVQMYRKS